MFEFDILCVKGIRKNILYGEMGEAPFTLLQTYGGLSTAYVMLTKDILGRGDGIGYIQNLFNHTFKSCSDHAVYP